MKNKQKYKNPADDIYKNSMTKGVYLLPNLLTSLSLFSGFYSIINSINGKFYIAGWLIVLSIFLDGVDGKVARLTNTSSKFGLEYDSLSDLVAFGVAPSVLIYTWQLRVFGKLGWVSIFVYLLGASLRLARFNVQVNSIEYKKFSGLPSPAAAGLVVFSIFLLENIGYVFNYGKIMIVAMIITGLLMISNIGYFAMKDFSVFKRRPFEILAILSLLIIIVIAKPIIMLFLIFFFYAFISPILYFYINNGKITLNKYKLLFHKKEDQ